jgi:hypothetical protein
MAFDAPRRPGRGLAMAALVSTWVLVLATVASPAGAATPGLVLGYGFERVTADGSLVDSSASQLNGHRMGLSLALRAASVAGHGKALTFASAQQQLVYVGDAPALDVDHFTLTAWVRYVASVHDDRWEVLEKDGAYWMNIRTDTRRVRVGGFFGGCGAAGRWIFLDSSTAVPAATWVHLAGTYDGATLRVYVNGVLSASRAVTGTLCSNASPLGIGAKINVATGGVEAYFDGRIDDLEVYDRALSAAEIRTVRGTPLS